MIKLLGPVLVILSFAVIMFVSIAKTKADTLICQTIMEDPVRVIIFSEGDENITDISASLSGHSYVKYTDGRKLYISPNTFDCHETIGKNDKAEQQLVDIMVKMITGGDLE